MSNPTISIPRSQKRWPISTIFTPENMHAIFVPYLCRHPFNSRIICGNSWWTIVPQSSPSSYHFRSHHRTAFVTLFIPPSSPFSYHLRSARIFQTLINQPIPKFPEFPNFPKIPAFPRFPCFPRHPQISTFAIEIINSSVIATFCSFVLLSKYLLFFCLNSFLLLFFCLYYFSPSVLLSKYLLSFCLKIKICSFLVQSTTLK